MELGIQISSVRPMIQDQQGVRESFHKVARIGYEYIQIQWVGEQVPPEFIRDVLQESGMTCVGTQDYTEIVLPQLDEVIRWNELWGGKYVCISGIPKERMTLDGCIAFAREVGAIARQLRDRGMTLTFHPRAQEFAQLGGRAAADILAEETDGSFQFLPDVFHVQKAGVDPADWIRSLAGRADLVHFKDMASTDMQDKTLAPVGQGALDWQSILAACRQSGVKYGFAEQETWDKDPFECLEEAYRYLRERM